jgi:hypothetical protein
MFNNNSPVRRVLALGLIAAASAAAATQYPYDTVIVTPPLVAEGASVLDCYITNVSDRDRNVRIEALTRDGIVAATFDVSLRPFTEKVVTTPATALARFCRFSVEGRSDHYRASILVREPGRGSISALAAF